MALFLCSLVLPLSAVLLVDLLSLWECVESLLDPTPGQAGRRGGSPRECLRWRGVQNLVLVTPLVHSDDKFHALRVPRGGVESGGKTSISAGVSVGMGPDRDMPAPQKSQQNPTKQPQLKPVLKQLKPKYSKRAAAQAAVSDQAAEVLQKWLHKMRNYEAN